MNRILRAARPGLLGVLAALALVYAGDFAYARYRLAHRTDTDPFIELRVYYGALLKNGKVEIFYDSPQTELCVRALFPQLGATPCWYAQRTNVRVLRP